MWKAGIAFLFVEVVGGSNHWFFTFLVFQDFSSSNFSVHEFYGNFRNFFKQCFCSCVSFCFITADIMSIIHIVLNYFSFRWFQCFPATNLTNNRFIMITIEIFALLFSAVLNRPWIRIIWELSWMKSNSLTVCSLASLFQHFLSLYVTATTIRHHCCLLFLSWVKFANFVTFKAENSSNPLFLDFESTSLLFLSIFSLININSFTRKS